MNLLWFVNTMPSTVEPAVMKARQEFRERKEIENRENNQKIVNS